MILKLTFKLCQNCEGATNNQSINLREWENEKVPRQKALPYLINNDFTNPKSNPFYAFKALPNALDLILTYDTYSFLSLVALCMSKKLKAFIQFCTDSSDNKYRIYKKI